MKFRLSIFPAAIADVDAAAEFIARDSLAAALRFYDSVDSTYRQIREHPKRYPRYELDDIRLVNLRRLSVVNFKNHLVFYRLEGSRVEIIRVLHGARDIAAILSDELTNE